MKWVHLFEAKSEAKIVKKKKKKKRGYPAIVTIMEDSSEENKVSADMGKKRTLKTPDQLNALENFYNDHKFPTEEMKMQLAQKLELTEKQISSWFCHRRLKDKRRGEGYANGRQDYSSGVIQDHGSGLKQDSCGSIKQGDYNNVDPREVESQRNCANDFPVTEQKCGGLRHKPKAYVNRSDDPSSESSSGLQNQVLSESVDPYNIESSVHLKPNGCPIATRDKKLGHRPVGYLKLKGEVENPAISAVKRQLGMQYREDGPPLSVEFDHLPPGAFDYPDNDPVDDTLGGPIYVKNPRPSHSPEVYPHPKGPILDARYQVPSSKMSRWDSSVEDAAYNSDNWPGRNSRVLKQRSPFLDGSNPCPAWDSSLKTYETSAGKVSRFQSNLNRMSSKHDMEGLSDPFPNYDRPYGKKVSKEQLRPLLPDGLNSGSKISRRDGNQPSNTTLGYREDELDPDGRVPSAILEKAVKRHGDYKPKRVYRDPSSAQLNPVNEIKVPKGFKDEFLQPDYVGKASIMRSLPNQVKGSSMDVLSSFSEDEAAENSPSFEGAT